ncbi:MAG TPA: signal peptidase I [Terriglobales bacterium]|nr:signal peptidase I [Terriglobales bacterium]
MAKKKTGVDPKKPEKPKETTSEFIMSMAAVFVTGLFIVTFNLQAFEIPSTSMKDTLLVGDHLFVDRTTAAPSTSWIGPLVPYREVKRNDIVVFISPIQPGLHVVKRIIGIPGDRIRLVNREVFRNGEKMTEPYVRHSRPYDPFRDEFPSEPPVLDSVTPEWHVTLGTHVHNGELIVPEGSYFAMGDNRDVSYDSRYWGFIPRSHIIGRPMFIYWSFNTPEADYQQTGMIARVGNLLKTALHFFDETRWSRTLRLVH